MESIPDVGDSEPKNEGPNHPKYEFQIAVDDIYGLSKKSWAKPVRIVFAFRADVGELDASRCDKFQCLVYVLRFLNSHPRCFVVSTEGDISCTSCQVKDIRKERK